MRKNIVEFAKVISLISVLAAPSTGLSAGSMSSSYSSDGTKKENDAYSMSSSGRFGEAEVLINQKNFDKAYLVLSKLSIVGKDEADRQNLLGFTARKNGRLETAKEHYKNALTLNPKHRGALEYQGELFLMLGKIEEAKLNLVRLKEQYWLSYIELTKLQKAIDKY